MFLSSLLFLWAHDLWTRGALWVSCLAHMLAYVDAFPPLESLFKSPVPHTLTHSHTRAPASVSLLRIGVTPYQHHIRSYLSHCSVVHRTMLCVRERERETGPSYHIGPLHQAHLFSHLFLVLPYLNCFPLSLSTPRLLQHLSCVFFPLY